MKLKAQRGETYDLRLIVGTYQMPGDNWHYRTYLWLDDAKTWEPFADISVNDLKVDVTSEDEILINPDFEHCFKDVTKMREWLYENLPAYARWVHWWYHTISIHNNKLNLIKDVKFIEPHNKERCCNECWKWMLEWFVIDWWLEYYCSEECLYKHYTPEERDEMYDNWNSDSYWTERECEEHDHDL